jgi:hypothetical protein
LREAADADEGIPTGASRSRSPASSGDRESVRAPLMLQTILGLGRGGRVSSFWRPAAMVSASSRAKAKIRLCWRAV